MRRYCLLVLALILVCYAQASEPIRFSALTMTGSSGKKESVTVLSGNAQVSVGTLSISADSIELSGTDYRFVRASGTVRGSDSENGFSFSADILDYDRVTEIASFSGNSSLSDTKNNVEASAGIINYNRKTEVALLQHGVKLKKNNISCTAGFALYRRILSSLELSGSPVVLRDSDEFKADRIRVNLETERILLEGSVSGTLKEEQKAEKTEGKTEEPKDEPEQ